MSFRLGLRCTIPLVTLALLLGTKATAQSVQYRPVSPDVIELRLHKYASTNAQRETTLKQLFAEAGKDEVATTEAMVNLDTLGLAPTEVWASHGDKRLTATIFYVGKQLTLPVSAVNVDNIGSSDSESFAERKVPAITVHSLTQDAWNARILHTSKDRISAIRMDDYYGSYALLSGYIAVLDQLHPEPTAN